MLHRDHYISLLVPLFNILETLCNFFQTIASVNHRLQLPSRSQFCDQSHSLKVVDSHTTSQSPAPNHGRPKTPRYVSQTHDASKKHTVGFQRVSAAIKCSCADDVKYQVVGFSIPGEIFFAI